VFRPGDTIRVNVRLKEGEEAKERIQPFEGVVMSRRGELLGESFTVRRVSFGIGVERIFPVHSPMISSIDVVRQGRVRRAKPVSYTHLDVYKRQEPTRAISPHLLALFPRSSSRF